MEWIRVQDGMPEDGARVLVSVRKVLRGLMREPSAAIMTAYCGGFDGAGDDIVTHWMPLPDPPKE